ncbi:hypothetical protein KUCAC02_037326, partial [Chaenocephalus aceratus]
ILVKGSTVVRDGRALLVHLNFMGKDFNVLNTYGFNDKNDRYDLLEDLQPHMLEELIHPDQACAVPGRKITDSLLLIRDTICLARDRNFRLVVLNLDFEKAFDRVSHQYLSRTLDLTDWFGQASGSKLNVSKTQAQFYGPWTETIGLPLTVTQTEQKILGIKFDNEGGGKTNWTSLEREPVSPVHGLAFGEPSTVWCNCKPSHSDKQTPGYVMD